MCILHKIPALYLEAEEELNWVVLTCHCYGFMYTFLTPLRPMEFYIKTDIVQSGWLIDYRGVTGYNFLQKIVFLSLKIDFG